MAETTIEWEIVDTDGDYTMITIRGEVEPLVPGRYSGLPEDCYPDEGGCASIVAILTDDGEVWAGKLSPAVRGAIEGALVEQEQRDREEEEGEAAVSRFEAMQEEGCQR